MIKAPVSLQELRRRIYRKAKSEKAHRFWGIFVHVTKTETLREAYRIAKRNGGACGIDGVTFEDIESKGVELFLAEMRCELISGTYEPQKNDLSILCLWVVVHFLKIRDERSFQVLSRR